MACRKLFLSPKLFLALALSAFLLGLCLLGGSSEAAHSGHREGRVVVVGDVHGCAAELSRLLEALAFSSNDQLIFVGDLIGKGPAPRETLRIARAHGARAVQGNHEFNLLRWRKRGAPMPDPEKKVSSKYLATVAELQDEDWRWLDSLPLTLQLELPVPTMVVHAGLLPGVPLEQQKHHDLVHLRSLDSRGRGSEKLEGVPWAKRWRGPQQVIFGHDARRGLQQEDFAVGLDTGCVYGGHLTALALPKTWTSPLRLAPQVSVPAMATYAARKDKNHSR
ncbi:unnamed protein product [Effrenium voratum]|nr:unnamed protein product [Effrenium voratum]